MSPVMSKLVDASDGVVGTRKLFDGASFKTAARMILASPHGAVDYADLRRRVGAVELECMIKSDLLGVRPYSLWPRDLDTKAYAAVGQTVRLAVSWAAGATAVKPARARAGGRSPYYY